MPEWIQQLGGWSTNPKVTNLGLVGPRIAEFGEGNRDGAAAKLVDNPDSWLAFTDLVLIDPIGTGWSRTAKSDGEGAFYGVRQDADVLAKVIALYVANNSRTASPKFLLGESYGGFRAAKVARALQSDQGIVVSGIAMVSPFIVYSRRTLLPNSPQKRRPVATPIDPRMPEACSTRCMAAAARTARAALSSCASGGRPRAATRVTPLSSQVSLFILPSWR